jgi:hypothetical protein
MMVFFFLDSSTNMSDARVFLVDQTWGGGGAYFEETIERLK